MSRRLSFFLWKRKRKSSMGNAIILHYRIVSTVKRVEFIRDWVSCIVLKGRWCNIIVLKMHAPSEEKSVIQKTVL